MPLQNALRDITHVIADLDESREASKKQVNDSFDLLERALRHRKSELLGNIETIYIEKHSKLVKQADEAERRARNLEEGLDVILLSLCPLQTNYNEGDEVGLSGDVNHNASSADVRLFFIHKQVSETLSELCNDEYHLDLSNGNTDGRSSDSSTYESRSVSEGSINPMNSIVPCENSHITLNNTHDLTKIDLMISNLGFVETSHAVAEKCEVSGQTIITGFCKAGEENSIVLTAKMFSGEAETTGKVQVSVNIKYVGPPDKSDFVTYRSLRSNHTRSTTIRNTWDGSRLPVSSYSKSNPTTPRRRTSRSGSKEADSPTTFERRSPLKDLLFSRTPEPFKTEVSGSSPKYEAMSASTSVTSRVDYIKNGAYKITFTPGVPGKYRISVELYGKPLPNGSFVMTAIDTTSRVENRQSRESLIPTRSSNNRSKVTKDESDR